jgi:hypothetical protein
LTIFLEAAGIKKNNMPYRQILPTNFILTSKNLGTMLEESSQMQEAYNLDYDGATEVFPKRTFYTRFSICSPRLLETKKTDLQEG